MKKLLFSLLALAITAVSCQQDLSINYEGSDAVPVNISVNVPDLGITRSGETDMDSAKGAIDNYTEANLWGEYDIRYILEIFDVTPGYVNLDRPIKSRMVNILDEYEQTTFELRLIPNRKYKFVVWADFVANGSYQAEDKSAVVGLNYDVTDLRNITRTKWAAMDESMDAYFIQQDIDVTSMFNATLTLKRPFGKIRVIASDIMELNYGAVPHTVNVEFYNHPTLSSLNALTGNVATERQTVSYSYTVSKDAPYNKGWDSFASHQTIFSDYLYASDNASEVNFRIRVAEADGREISSHDFNTQIPLQRNHLTTIIGNLLTTATEINVNIDDNFDGEYINDIDTEATELTSWGASSTDADNNLVYVLNNGNADFTLVINKSAAENGTLKAGVYNYATNANEENTFTITGLQAETRALVAVNVIKGTMTVTANNDATSTVDFDLYLNYGKDSDGMDIIYNALYTFTGVIATSAPKPTALETPNAQGKVVEYKNVTISWGAVENAEYYTVACGLDSYTVMGTEYTFNLKYDTTYTFEVKAYPAEGSKLYLASEPAIVTVTTEADPYIYLKPNSNWTQDNARFAVYSWNNDNDTTWVNMTDSDNDGIYEVLKSSLKANLIFCRMNPSTTANNWNNKWNQTGDLTLPTNGNNLYTIASGAWDKGSGNWSKK